MKHFLLLIILFSSLSAAAQFDVDKNKYAWERTAYERWDKFQPALYFKLFAKKYKKTDKRTMATRSVTMSLWAMQADQYKIYSRSVDSVYKMETQKAMDRALNKNYVLFQRKRDNRLRKTFEELIDKAITIGMAHELYFGFQKRYLAIVDNISFLKSAYAPDADKYPLIEKELERLEEYLRTFKIVIALEELIVEFEDLPPPLILDGPLNQIDKEIKSIIK